MTDALKPIEPHLRDLAEATTIRDVKEVRDRAAALQAYAREAGDSELLDHAVEVRLNAERKAGQLLVEMAERGERMGGRGGDRKSSSAPELDLADLGLTKKQSHFWQRLAEMTDEAFAERLTVARRTAWAAIELTAAERQAEKRERRDQRERELAERTRALPDKRYGVIYADPEWRFEPWSRETGMDRAADNHYPTSELDDIKARDVTSIAADDCVLFLCATVPMLLQALEVMASWGFKYVSHFIWLKDKIGTGYWNRNIHELLLVGVKGDIPCAAPGTQWDSVLQAPTSFAQRAHSEKPAIFYELIEAYFPTLPKIELNARERRAGWDAWGNEAPAEAS
jgi:N6-adenosine-specific RNA methylase IME4